MIKIYPKTILLSAKISDFVTEESNITATIKTKEKIIESISNISKEEGTPEEIALSQKLEKFTMLIPRRDVNNAIVTEEGEKEIAKKIKSFVLILTQYTGEYADKIAEQITLNNTGTTITVNNHEKEGIQAVNYWFEDNTIDKNYFYDNTTQQARIMVMQFVSTPEYRYMLLYGDPDDFKTGSKHTVNYSFLSSWNSPETTTIVSPTTGKTYILMDGAQKKIGEGNWSGPNIVRCQITELGVIEYPGFNVSFGTNQFELADIVTADTIVPEPKEIEIKIPEEDKKKENYKVIEFLGGIEEIITGSFAKLENINFIFAIIKYIEKIIESYYVRDGTIIFNKPSAKEDETTKLLDEFQQLSQKMADRTITEADAKKLIEEMKNKVSDFLAAAGITDETTDEELNDIIDEAAEELQTALANGDFNPDDTDNELAKEILKQLSKDDKEKDDKEKEANPTGLRKDYYEVMKSIQNIQDIRSLIYSNGLAKVTSDYFSKGLMHITIHTGGICIAAVGTTMMFQTTANVPPETITIQTGAENTNFPNQVYQAEGIRDGYSNEFTNGTTMGMVVGVKQSGNAVVPFVGTDSNTQINHSPVKILIFVAVLAAFLLLSAAALAAQGIGGVISSKMVDSIRQIKEQILEQKQKRIIQPFDDFKELQLDKLKKIIDNQTKTAKKKLEEELTLISEIVQPKINKIANVTLTKMESGVDSLITKVNSSLKKNKYIKKFGSSATKRIDSLTKKAKDGVKKGKEKALKSSANLANIVKNNAVSKINSMTDEEVNKVLNDINTEYNKIDQMEKEVKANVVDNVNNVESKIDNVISIMDGKIGMGGDKLFRDMVGIPNNFKDGNDLFAAMMAASVKASLGLTIAQTQCSSVGSTGIGTLIPIGP